MKRILFATIGSLGDLHPCLALAVALQARGHVVAVASSPYYRPRIEALGLVFHALRPDWNPTDTDLIRQCEDLKRGPEVLFRNLILPHLQDTWDDLLAAATEFRPDLMVAGEIVYPAPLLAEKLNLAWASAILSPTAFFSAHDPSLLVNVPNLYRLRSAGPIVNRAFLNLGRAASRHWWRPVRELRRREGLNPACDPLFRDKFSPWLVLALFARAWAQPQPDWPPNTVQPGFVFHDRDFQPKADPKLEAFLAAGSSPVVFTLGSAAVVNPGHFYEIAAAASARLGRRALFLGAPEAESGSAAEPYSLSLPYAPYSLVFPHAAAIVHQGGSGTIGQSLRAGKPTLVVPYGWDQPDNAARLVRLGAALTIPRSDFNADTASGALHRLLHQPSFSERATQLKSLLEPDALTAATDALESLLATR